MDAGSMDAGRMDAGFIDTELVDTEVMSAVLVDAGLNRYWTKSMPEQRRLGLRRLGCLE